MFETNEILWILATPTLWGGIVFGPLWKLVLGKFWEGSYKELRRNTKKITIRIGVCINSLYLKQSWGYEILPSYSFLAEEKGIWFTLRTLRNVRNIETFFFNSWKQYILFSSYIYIALLVWHGDYFGHINLQRQILDVQELQG